MIWESRARVVRAAASKLEYDYRVTDRGRGARSFACVGMRGVSSEYDETVTW